MSRHFKALVWGCGQIGAGYDFESDQVLTHAKAYFLDPRFCLSVYDKDQTLAQKVAQRYAAEAIQNLTDDILKSFDIVSICTPTRCHFEQLLRLIALEIPVILCEKPLATQESQLKDLQNRKLGRSKVVVNYMRRFSPGYSSLRDEISDIMPEKKLLQICIRYQRGWMNTASHALDLIAFLFDRVPKIQEAKILRVGPPEPDLEEPTISAFLTTDLGPIFFSGFESCVPPTFEIDLFFDTCRYFIDNRGDRVIRKDLGPDNQWTTGPICSGLLLNYMLPVLDVAASCLADRGEGNWEAALEVNLAMTRIFKQ